MTQPGAVRKALQVGALYAGGFLGPFGGGVVAAMLPEIGADLGVSTNAASTSLTAYLLPFAAVMLVSGTLGARWGRVRTVRLAYAVYIVASIGCVLAPTLPILLGARILQGCANAFTTPLLLSALAALTPKRRLGRVLGTFGALQAAGQTSAPLIGGLAAEVDWRLAFGSIAVVAAVLGAIGLPTSVAAIPTDDTARLREALRLDVVRVGIIALLGWGALGGLNFLLAFRAEDAFGLGPTSRGLLLTCFGIAGILTARPVGAVIDAMGARRAVILGAIVGGALVAVVGTAGLLIVTAAAWALAGVAAQFVLVGVNAAVLGSQGANRSGAVSVVQSFRFTGAAIAPLLLTPVYEVHQVLAFVVPAALLAVSAPLVMPGSRGKRRKTDNADG